MRRLTIALATAAGVLVLAASALATHVPTTGTPIRLLNPAVTPTTFAAETPFFVRHGYTCLPEEKAICLDPTTEFKLYVDGHRVRTALDLEQGIACSEGMTPVDECSARLNVANFRFGLAAGTHSLRGEWWLGGDLSILREATIQFVG